jgi:hypothetical protein
MESYIPLVKAIIISSIFTFGSSVTWITDDVIVRQYIYKDPFSEKTDTSYGAYNLKSHYVYIVDERLYVRDSSHIDTIAKYSPSGISRTNIVELGNQNFKDSLDSLQCKVLRRELKSIGMIPSSHWNEYSYYAKIPWLDKVLNTEEKRKAAGFPSSEFSSYNYLVYQYKHDFDYEKPQIQLKVTINVGSIDKNVYSKIFGLPPGRDFMIEVPKN